MSDKIKFVIIKDNGNIVTIFTSDNNFDDNIIEISADDSIDCVINYYESNKDRIRKDKDGCDNHIFYLRDYLKTHFQEEFKKMNIDPATINDDLYLYYLVSSLNNIVIVNSPSHTDIAVIPKNSINKKQIDSLNKAVNLFDDSINWCVADNMHLEIIEEDGKKFKWFNHGETKNGKLKNIIIEYNNNELKTR